MELAHPDELRADFQQYYGLDLDGMGADYTHEHAACLAVQLPRESRTARAMAPEAEWGWAEALLAAIEYNTRWLVWAQSKDAQKGRNRPEPLDGPGATRERKARETDFGHIEEILGRGHGS